MGGVALILHPRFLFGALEPSLYASYRRANRPRVVLVDPEKQRIARIDGTLFKDVGFGWGILGHLDRGGHFQVDQADVNDDNWTIARMDLAFTGKVLLFKSIDIKSTEIYGDFRPVPADLTFAQGIQLLKQQQAAIAQNQPPSGSSK